MTSLKPWYQSKTLWANFAMFAGALFAPAGVLGHVFAPEEVAAGFGLVNVFMRAITTKGLSK